MMHLRNTWSMRTYLLALVLAVGLPLAILAVIALVVFDRQQRETSELQLVERAHSMSLALDRELTAVSRALQALARATFLEESDFLRVHEQASRTIAVHAGWEAIVVIDSSGQQVMNTRVPFGSPLPQTGSSELAKVVFTTAKPAVSNLFVGPLAKRPLIAVSVPVVRDGSVRYALNLSTSPATLTNILLQAKLPSGWIATVVDRNQTIVARTQNLEEFFGTQAGPVLAAKSAEGGRGFFRSTTREGTQVVAGYHRSELSGFTLAIGIPAAEIEEPLWHTLNIFIGGTLAFFVLAASFALLVGSRVTQTYKKLVRAAVATMRGATFCIAPLPIAEADELARAFADASAQRSEAEKARRASEERYRTLFEAMDEGFCVIEMIYDQDGNPADYRFLEINPAFMSQTGLTDALTRTIREMVPEHDAHWFEIYGKVARTGEAIRFENPARAMQRHYDVFAFRIGADESRRVGILFRDITERKRAEENQARLAAIVEHATIAIFTRTLDGTITSWNAGAERMLGYTAAEAIGRPVTTFARPPGPPFNLTRNTESLLRGEVVARESNRITKDGRVIDVLGSFSPLRDGAGNIVGASVILQDITERKRAEGQLRERFEELRRWYSAMLDREDRVRVLKHEVNELLKSGGQPARYTSQENA